MVAASVLVMAHNTRLTTLTRKRISELSSHSSLGDATRDLCVMPKE